MRTQLTQAFALLHLTDLGMPTIAALLGFFVCLSSGKPSEVPQESPGVPLQEPVVKVTWKGGQELFGKVRQLTSRGVVLEEVSGKVISLDLPEVFSLAPVIAEDLPSQIGPVANLPGENRWVYLRQGSILVCQRLTSSEGGRSLECQLAGSMANPINVPWQAVQAVRFRPLSEQISPAWNELLNRPEDRDWIAVVFDSNVDYYSGTLLGLREGELEFELEGERFTIGFSRLLGLKFGGLPTTSGQALVARVEHRGGSQILASQLVGDGQKIEAQIEPGLAIALPWHEISKVDFRHGRVISLDRLPVLRARYFPILPLPGLESALTELLLPPLGKEFAEESLSEAIPTLLFPVGSEVLWQLPEGTWELSAYLRVVSKGPVNTVVRAEWASEAGPKKEVCLEIGGSEKLEIDLGTSRTLRLKVEAKSGAALGVFLEVKEGRVVRKF